MSIKKEVGENFRESRDPENARFSSLLANQEKTGWYELNTANG